MKIWLRKVREETIDRILILLFIVLALVWNYHIAELFLNVRQNYLANWPVRDAVKMLENVFLVFFTLNVFVSYSVVTLTQWLKKHKNKLF